MILLLNPLLSNVSDASSDEVIVSKYLKSQNGAYFDILYKRYSAKVYARSISLLKNEVIAQDAVQDIFIKILTNLSKFEGKSKFSSWLYSITYNHCIDYIRRNKKSRTLQLDEVFDLEAEKSEIDDKLILETQFSQLKYIMEEIPPKDKSILFMKYQDGMSIKDISEVTNKSESAVKMQIKRAKEKFMNLKDNFFPAET